MALEVKCSGWMTKQGGSIKTWRKRWFELKTDGQIYYYIEPGGVSCGPVSE